MTSKSDSNLDSSCNQSKKAIRPNLLKLMPVGSGRKKNKFKVSKKFNFISFLLVEIMTGMRFFIHSYYVRFIDHCQLFAVSHLVFPLGLELPVYISNSFALQSITHINLRLITSLQHYLFYLIIRLVFSFSLNHPSQMDVIDILTIQHTQPI